MKRKLVAIVVACALLACIAAVYVRTQPLVFMDTHAHCIKMAGLALEQYADGHERQFPYHPDGYAYALLLLDDSCYHALTGPGYDAGPLRRAKETGAPLPEEACGRVYLQGLTKESKTGIALLFDKLPTPGGDHCHRPVRLWAPLGREVWFVGGHVDFIRENDWPEFARRQVELLAEAGFDRGEAERLYSSESK